MNLIKLRWAIPVDESTYGITDNNTIECVMTDCPIRFDDKNHAIIFVAFTNKLRVIEVSNIKSIETV